MRRSMIFLVDVLTNATVALILLFVVFVTRQAPDEESPRVAQAGLLVVEVTLATGGEDVLVGLHQAGAAGAMFVGEVAEAGAGGNFVRRGRADAELSRSLKLGVPGFHTDGRTKTFVVPCFRTGVPYVLHAILGTVLGEPGAQEQNVEVVVVQPKPGTHQIECPECGTNGLAFGSDLKVAIQIDGPSVCTGNS